MNTLKELNEEIKKCKKCDLYKRRKNVVTGRGSISPLIVFVGEAPGKEEDRQGKPFVGASGKLLDKWIDELGLKSNQYAILNVVKCIPLTDDGLIRRPHIWEISSCLGWLEKQIEFLNPKLIIALGSVASTTLTDEMCSMRDLENKLFKKVFNGIDVFCFRHPASFLYKEEKADLTIMKKVVKEVIDEFKES